MAFWVIKYDHDGETHIQGQETLFLTHETLCGNVDTGDSYERVDEPVTCHSCKQLYEGIKKSRKKISFK